MIFKTFNSDLDGIINKFGMFNKSFATMKRDYSKGNGLLTSIFSGKNITSKDVSAIQAMNESMKNGSTVAQAWQANMRGCTTAAKEQVKQCLLNKGSLSELSTSMETMTVSAKAGKVALQGLAMVGNMLVFTGISMAISELINIISDCVTVSDRLQESAEQLGGEFSNTKTDIDGYKAKIEELYKTINDSSSSYSETTQARKDLMSIQDELIDKYGSEESAIKNITDAINGQSDALDKLTAKEWTDTKNKFNDSKFPDKVMNKLEGYNDNIDRMLNEYGNYTATIDLSKYGGTLFTKGYDDFKKTLIKDFGAKISDYGKEYL